MIVTVQTVMRVVTSRNTSSHRGRNYRRDEVSSSDGTLSAFMIRFDSESHSSDAAVTRVPTSCSSSNSVEMWKSLLCSLHSQRILVYVDTSCRVALVQVPFNFREAKSFLLPFKTECWLEWENL